MIKKRIKVPIYNFKVDFCEIESEKDDNCVKRFLKSVRMAEDIIEEICEAVKEDSVDGGWTLANLGRKHIVIVLLRMRSASTRRRVLSHEKRHCEDDILKHCDIDDDEAAGYLAGFLGENIY